MRPHRYTSTALFVCALALVFTVPAAAQYGSGIVIDVPYASSPINIDGSDDDPDWELATFVDLVQQWESGWVPGYGDPDVPDAVANARLLWREGVLYMYIYVEQLNHEVFFNAEGNPWESSHLLVGVDLTGEDDEAYAHDWTGWPENAPNLGAVTYKANPAHGVTLNWGFDEAPDPVAEGWVEAAMVVSEDDMSWALELAIHGEEDIVGGAQIGFNIAGAIASNPPGHEWGWFVYSICDPVPSPPPGGETRCHWAGGVQSDARGYSLLNLEEPSAAFVQVPRASGPIVLDGVMDEAAWEDAVSVSLTNFWNSGYYAGWGDPEVPDVFADAYLLWDDEVLYVFIDSEHAVPMLFMPPSENPWDANQILVGIDLTNADTFPNDDSWSGWPWNAPDLGPTTYKINPAFGGITLNWGGGWDEMPDGVDPIKAGFVDGAITVDEVAQRWTVEMAIYGEQIAQGNEVKFNVGGAASNEEMCPPIGPEDECTYAWFSWNAISIASAGGDVTRVHGSFGSLQFVPFVSTEDGSGGAARFAISENFPNPFRTSTTVVYELARDGAVEIELFDVLGRRIAVYEEGARAAGQHQVTVDGNGLASGLYMVRLNVDGQSVASRTMMRLN